MRSRLAVCFACLLVALGGAAPALAAHNDRAKTKTTSSTTTTKSATKATARHRHHPKASKGAKAGKAGAAAKAAASPASTAKANEILNECQSHGQLTHQFTRPQLKKALAIMSSSTAEYSNCSDVIHNALLHGIKKSDANSSGGSSSTTTIVIIVVVVLVLLAAIFGGLAVRRRRGGGGGDGSTPADA